MPWTMATVLKYKSNSDHILHKLALLYSILSSIFQNDTRYYEVYSACCSRFKMSWCINCRSATTSGK